MQSQGNIGVFRGIGASLLKPDLVKGKLLRPLTCNILEMNCFLPQILQGKAVHVVSGGG